MIEFTEEFRNSDISFKRGETYCEKCRCITTQERYRRTNQHGIISSIYRCEDCNKLTTKYKKE